MAEPQQKVLYILGTQRGGSTIFGRVVGNTPGFAFAGEVRRLWERGLGPGRTCGCGQPFDVCPVWSKALPAALGTDVTPEQMAGWQREVAPPTHSWRRSDCVLAHREQPARWPHLASYVTVMDRLYPALARAYGTAVLIDGSKLPADAAVLSCLPGVDPYYLHLVRDPRGVLASQLRRAGSGRDGRPPLRRAAYGSLAWSARQLSARHLARRLPSARILQLRYEEFVADPDATVAAVRDFVGAPPSPSSLRASIALPLVHTPGGVLPATAARLVEDTRWRSELSRPERTAITLLTLPLLRRFGYSRAG